MEGFLAVCVLVVLVICWIYLRNRFDEIEARIATLERLSIRVQAQPPVAQVVGQVVGQPERDSALSRPVTGVSDLPSMAGQRPAPLAPAPPAPPAPPTPPPPAPQPAFTTLAPRRSTEDWETLVGGNWLNKAGVFVLVIGIALGLGYSFTRMGPGGRVAISIAASLAMLAGGIVMEPRERYRTFARGLLGGGWAALYFTVYASQAVGMIAHSLRYRSETVTGLAYFIAFVTLAITEVTPLSVIALVPLAASLLYVAHRFSWSKMALFGLIATYATCASRGDTGAPLWQTQAIFSIYWLLFESFDLVRPWRVLLPLNAIGFLGLSVMKWHAAAPEQLWQLLAAAAAAYLAGAVARARSGWWQGAATLTAALAAAAIFLKLDHQWIALALLVEAELFYLAGIRFRAPWLRHLAASLFAVELGRLMVADLADLPARAWEPVAALNALVFYANRVLRAADTFYGYAAAGMVALIAGYEAPAQSRGPVWSLLAAGPFLAGWWRRQLDFRIQGYSLALLGAVGTAIAAPHPPLSLAVSAALGYAAALCALWSGPDRFLDEEREALRFAASLAATLGAAALVWRLAPGEYLGLCWMALALPLLELGLRGIPADFRRQAYVVAAAGVLRILDFDAPLLHNHGPLPARLVPAGAALAAYAIAARAWKEERGRVLAIASCTGTGFLLTAFWALLPPLAVAPAWAAVALALVLCAPLRWQSYAVAALAFARCWYTNFEGAAQPVLAGAAVIACFYAAQLLTARGGRPRLFYSLLATALATVLLYYEVSGSLRTVAWGIEGVVLLASGFPLRDRVPRLSGLALLLACILKLFVWDLRHLDTLPRIFSFIVLGLILVAVSWIYTRFRDLVQRYL
jgi:hypothetical protein